MKYCTKCGHELFDEAIICTNCGCMIKSISTEVKHLSKNSSPSPERKETTIAAFNFVFDLVTICSFFFIVMALATGEVRTYIYNRAGYYARSYYSPNSFPSVLALLCSISSLGFGIVSFILALVKRLKCEKLLGAITRLIAGILTFIVSLTIIMLYS